MSATLVVHTCSKNEWNQSRWSDFFDEINRVIISYHIVAIFRGTSLPTDKLAKACWIIEMQSMDDLQQKLLDISHKYENQIHILLGGVWK